MSAHGSDSKVVDDWFVVPWDRVPNHSEIEPRSPPIEGWFGPQLSHDLYDVASIHAPIARARVGRDRDARVTTGLGPVAIAQWTRTCYALVA